MVGSWTLGNPKQEKLKNCRLIKREVPSIKAKKVQDIDLSLPNFILTFYYFLVNQACFIENGQPIIT